MLYVHVDELIDILNNLVLEANDFSNGIFVNNINPFMIGVKILMINWDIIFRFPLSKIRVE